MRNTPVVKLDTRNELSHFIEDNFIEPFWSIGNVPKKKPDVIKVLRFFRMWDLYNNQVSSDGGMTAICVLNYVTGRMNVYPTFCAKGDNFDKKIGTKYAEESQREGLGFSIKFDKAESIFYNIYSAVLSEKFTWNDRDSKRILSRPFSNWFFGDHKAHNV